jgi:arylamine N-acetyltransferase
MVERHLGGYCYFHGLELCQILLGLGYSCRPVSAYVREGPPTEEKPEHMVLTQRPTHCCVLLELDGTTYLVDCGFSRRGPVTQIPLPNTQSPGDAGAQVGSPAPATESWHITVADLERISLPDKSERKLSDPTYILKHRSIRKGQTLEDAPWDILYAFTTQTEELEAYEQLSWHVCIGDKGTNHKFREYFSVARTYQPGINGPEYPEESNAMPPVDYSARLARLSLTNMELSAFEEGEKKVLCTFDSEDARLEGLRKWFGLSGPFDGKLGASKS